MSTTVNSTNEKVSIQVTTCNFFISFSELEFHYFLAEPSERRFLSYTHYRTATEARAPGSMDLNWCSLCRRSHTFQNMEQLNHFNLLHSIIAPHYSCPRCQRQLTYPSEFVEHLWECQPRTALDLRIDVVPAIYDAYADYIQLHSRRHDAHIIEPGLPEERSIAGSSSQTSPSIHMNPQTGTPLNVT